MSTKKFNRAAVERQLSGARVALDECIQKVRNGDYDGEDGIIVAIDFEQVLYHLNLAWHFKDLTDEQRDRLSQEDVKCLSNTVPNFGFELKLMAGIEADESQHDNQKQ